MSCPCPLVSALLLTLGGHEPLLLDSPGEVTGGLVVAVDPIAARVGADILRRGGNAVDAAIATALALAVTHPEAGNLGGGGFLVAKLANAKPFTVDFRETAPALATARMYLNPDGSVNKKLARVGWLVVGVPGSPSGLWTAHKHAGSLPWTDVVEPARALAERGFIVDAVLSRGLASQAKAFQRFGEPARVYLKADGSAPAPGETLQLPDLAGTLRRLQTAGADGFYRGPIAEKLDAAMRANGGLVRLADLAGYRAVVRPPVRGTYRGHEIIGIGPPSSGGVVLIQMLNMLERFEANKAERQATITLHRQAEAMRRAFLDRARHLGDPAFTPLPLDMLLSKERAAELHAGIGPRATPSAELGKDILASAAAESDSTTHFSVVDPAGGVVALTTTLEGSYGAKVIAPGTGFLLNNEMPDFNIQPGVTDAEGTIGTPANGIAPGKRMLSSQCPTLVLRDGQPLLVLGSPGGRTIINTVLQVLMNVIDHGMPIAEAVAAPRLHHQWMPDEIVLEKRFESAAAGLRELGHAVRVRGKQGDCHAIWIDPKTGRRHAGIDRRIRGGAAGFDRPEKPQR